MKTLKTLFILTLMIVVSIVACKKEEETPTPTPTPPTPTNPTDKFFTDNLTQATQSFIVDLNTYPLITGSNGVEIQLTPSSFLDANGNIVTGNIDIELIETQDNKNMLMLNRPTITDNGELLSSGGIVYVNATQNGAQLQINGAAGGLATTIPENGFANPSSPMLLFSGDTTANGDFVWIQDTGTVGLVWDTASYFNFNIDSVGWTNIDVIIVSPPNTETIDVILPSGHNLENSIVFMYFSDINSVVSLYWNTTDETFSMGIGYQLSIGSVVKFVVISEINNQWSYHVTSDISITDPHTETLPALTPAADEQAVQTAILNAL